MSTGIILCMRPTNERQHYNVMLSLIGWAYTQNDPHVYKCTGIFNHQLWYDARHCGLTSRHRTSWVDVVVHFPCCAKDPSQLNGGVLEIFLRCIFVHTAYICTENFDYRHLESISQWVYELINEILWKFSLLWLRLYDPVRSQICTCRACAKFWSDLMIIFHVKAT